MVKAWASGLTPAIYVNAMEAGEVFFIATGLVDGQPAVLGFASHRVDDEQDGASVYVRGEAARQGIGSSILRLFVLVFAVITGACATSSAVLVPGKDVFLPILVNNIRPYYTQDALTSRIEGTVLLNCVVRADGTVGDVQVARSLDAAHGLDAQAIQAVKLWTFKPGTKGGQPVAVRVPVEIAFTLR